MKKVIALSLVLLVGLTGCMEKNDESSEKSNDNENAKTQIELEGVIGTSSFDKPKEKVVALEWSIVEELLISGVQPVGIADIEGFEKWVKIDAKLDNTVADVGNRVEPNIEVIAKLQPDVIIGMKYQEEILSELEKIAPVVLYDNLDPSAVEDQYAYTLKTLRDTARIVGKGDDVETEISNFENKLNETKDNIEQLDLNSNEFVFTQAYSVNQAPTFRIFTTNSAVSHVLEKIGLKNKVLDDPQATSGFIESNVEGLVKYQDALFIHTVQEDDPLFDNLKDNVAWNGLQFVKNNDIYGIGGGVWTFGSIYSMETLINHVTNVIEK
ncbi:ABC transporter substrate-binding protein [Pseudogracilibacillus sp. SO30301A]|uniref:ABC transporter substrate-binding protein n=1 Tax=Pseudogracilibacillus sp. SO30301A TaxID=3098291 RepID=UPI00300E1C2D